MKRLIVLLLTLTLSWNSFSQNVTSSLDSTHIILSTEVAKQIAQDLLEGDKAKETAKFLGDYTRIQGEIILEQDSLIVNLNQKILIEKQNLQAAADKLHQDEILQERLRGQIKQARGWAWGLGATATVAVVTSIAVMIFKK